MKALALCGWLVESEMPLPDLAPWTGDGRQADLTIRLGHVPSLRDPANAVQGLQIAADGTCRFEIAGVARYRIDPSGSEIVIEPEMAIDAADIRAFLYGTVFATVCFRRGLLPLHASAVRIGDKAVAFAGVSGAGKSTLAATFFKRGFAILADDIAAIVPGTSTAPLLLPALPRLKLWRDMLDGLCIGPGGLDVVCHQTEKYYLPVAEAFATQPLPLTSVYHLTEALTPQEEHMTRLNAREGFLALEQGVYRLAMGRMILGVQPLFSLVGAVAGTVTSIRLARRKSLARAGAVVDEILRYECQA